MKLLIADTAQLKEFVGINADMDFASIQPYVAPAQRVVERFIGYELLADIIDAAYSQEEVLDPMATLVDLVRAPVATLAVISFVNANNVMISDMGIHRTQTAGLNDAFEWQVQSLRQELSETAYDGIESLMRYVERHLDLLPNYTASDVYKTTKGTLIRSAILFSEYYFIDNSRLVFQSLLPALRAAQKRRILPLLGQALIDTLLEADKTGTLTASQAKMLELAQEALTFATIARALRERVIQIGTQGVTVNGVNTIDYKKPVDEKSLQLSINHFDSEADASLSELTKLITPTVTGTSQAGRGVRGDKVVSF